MEAIKDEDIIEIFKGDKKSIELFKVAEKKINDICTDAQISCLDNQVVFSFYDGFAYLWVSEKTEIVLSLCFMEKVQSPLFYGCEEFSSSSYMYHAIISKASDLDKLEDYIKKAAKISKIKYFKQTV